MKTISILLFSLTIVLISCSSIEQSSDLPQADSHVTNDCALSNSEARIFLSTERVSGIEKANSMQISKIETDVSYGKLYVKSYIHIFDENLNFVDGFDDNKYICEIIDSSNFKKMQIKDFTIKKVSSSDKIPVYFAFVLDHSGSIGEDRAKQLQSSILEFVNNYMAEEDKLMIVKFDMNNQSTIFPAKNLAEFEAFSNQFFAGLSGFGSSTSLYDAIETGISELDYNSSGDYQKSLVVLTDGYENSSKLIASGAELVQLAKRAHISINTIGFGENVDKLLLADTLSMQSGGIFQNICNSEQLKMVFKDIYFRTKNHYIIEYSTSNYPAAHSIKIKLCDKSIKKSINAENMYLYPSKDKEMPIPIDVYFDFAKSTIKVKDSKSAIDIMDTLLRNDPLMKIEIQGHTDSVGSEKANQMLSENRAKAVMNALIAKGINKARITALGLGESKPIADNTSEEGRAANRRVVFVIKESSATIKRTTPFYKSPAMTSIK